jgi:hypothetical protein
VGLALLYAAIGVALGTFTGTALAVASLPPDASMMTGHLSFAKSIQSGLHIHPITNAGQTPVIQNHANPSSAGASIAPAVLASVTTPAGATPSVATPSSATPSGAIPSSATPSIATNQSANPIAASALLIHQAPVLPNSANSVASAPAPAQESHTANLSAAAAPTFLIHQPPPFQNRSFEHSSTPSAGSVSVPVVLSHSVILASNAGQPQILNLARITHPAPVVHTSTLQSTPATSTSKIGIAQITFAGPSHINASPVQKQISSDNTLASVAPLATLAQPPPSAPATAAPAPASLSAGLDSGFKPLTFYSEGDATVVSYDASGNTITTDDGRTFEIGSTVSASHAVSWQDYRSNVHYRCDQNGGCSLIRTGVIALNARLM